MSKSVILADFEKREKWDFQEALEHETRYSWDVLFCQTNRYHGTKIKVLYRYLIYFAFSFRMFLVRNRYNQVVAWQQFYGLLMAFFCRIFHVKRAPKIYVMTFIYKPKHALYHKFMQYIVSSDYITKLIVLSDEEKNYYAKLFDLPTEKFFCTRIGVTDQASDFPPEKDRKKYYLSVGRSNRDYKFLRDAWKKSFGELIIICDSYKEEAKDGITVLDHCYGDEYLQYVSNCYAQIIPMEDENISSGSLSFLQAMMLSRPTIVTENKTVHDYIESGRTGIIIEKTDTALEQSIAYLDDEAQYTAMCQAVREEFLTKYSEYSLGVSVSKMIMENK